VAFIDPVGKFCFKVEVDGITAAHFMAVTGISMEIEVVSHIEGGLNDRAHMLPGQGKQGAITLKRGYIVDQTFYDWLKEVADLAYQTANIRRDAHLILCSENMQELRRWTLEQAWPKKWNLDDLDANTGAIAVESLELAHFGFLPSGAERRVVESRRGAESDRVGSAASGGGQASASSGAAASSGSGGGGGSASGPSAFSRATERAARDAAAAVSGNTPMPVIEPPTVTPRATREASSLEQAWRHAGKRSPVADPAAFARAQMDAGTPLSASEMSPLASDGETRSSSGLVRTPGADAEGGSRWSDGVDAVQPPVLDGRVHFGAVFNE